MPSRRRPSRRSVGEDVLEQQQQEQLLQQQALWLASQDLPPHVQAGSTAFGQYPSSPPEPTPRSVAAAGSLTTAPPTQASAWGVGPYGTSHGSSLVSLPDPTGAFRSSLGGGSGPSYGGGEGVEGGGATPLPVYDVSLSATCVRDLAQAAQVRQAVRGRPIHYPLQGGAGSGALVTGGRPVPPTNGIHCIASGAEDPAAVDIMPVVRLGLVRVVGGRPVQWATALSALPTAPRLVPAGEPSGVEEGEGGAPLPTPTAQQLALEDAGGHAPVLCLLGSPVDEGGVATLDPGAVDEGGRVTFTWTGASTRLLLGAGGCPSPAMQGADTQLLFVVQVLALGRGGAEAIGTAFLPAVTVAAAPQGRLAQWLPLWLPGSGPKTLSHGACRRPPQCSGWVHVAASAALAMLHTPPPTALAPHPDVVALTVAVAQVTEGGEGQRVLDLVRAVEEGGGDGSPGGHPPHTPSPRRRPRSATTRTTRPRGMRAPVDAIGHDAAAVLPYLSGSPTPHRTSRRAAAVYASELHGTLPPPRGRSTASPRRPASAATRRSGRRSSGGGSAHGATHAAPRLREGPLRKQASDLRQTLARLRSQLTRERTQCRRLKQQVSTARRRAEASALALAPPGGKPGSASATRRRRKVSLVGNTVLPPPSPRSAQAASLLAMGQVDEASVVTGNLALGLGVPRHVVGAAFGGPATLSGLPHVSRAGVPLGLVGGPAALHARLATLRARAQDSHRRLSHLMLTKARAAAGRAASHTASRATVLKALTTVHALAVGAQREAWMLAGRGQEAAYAPVLDILEAQFGVFVRHWRPLRDDDDPPTWLVQAEAAAVQNTGATATQLSPHATRVLYVPAFCRAAEAAFPGLLRDVSAQLRRGLSPQRQLRLDGLADEAAQVAAAHQDALMQKQVLSKRLERRGMAAQSSLAQAKHRLAQARAELRAGQSQLTAALQGGQAIAEQVTRSIDVSMVQLGVEAGAAAAEPSANLTDPHAWSRSAAAALAALRAEIAGLREALRRHRSRTHDARLAGTLLRGPA